MSKQSISHLSSDIIATVEQAAIACYDWIGKGDNMAADAAAVKSMRSSLNKMNIAGTIVIGEGERDEAPMLYIGEKVGIKGATHKVDIALDPLEGTTICANAGESSLAVIAFAKRGGFLHAPDVYMDKIAVGAGLPEGGRPYDRQSQVVRPLQEPELLIDHGDRQDSRKAHVQYLRKYKEAGF